MWIRTSDGKKVIFCGTVGKLEASKYKNRISETLCESGAITSEQAGYVLLNGECIGEYDTEQRAIEILDEICIAYIGLNCVDRKTGIAVVKNGIFEMPEE